MDIKTLEKLKELKEKGLLTKEEFDKQIQDYIGSDNSKTENGESDNNLSKFVGNINISLGNLNIKYLFTFMGVCIGIYILISVIFPYSITCTEKASDRDCSCLRQAVAKNTNVLDKIKIIIVGASREEILSHIDFSDAMRCAMN